MPKHDLEGRTVGNYVLRELIDQGGVGLVFVAQHQYLDERAAVKILHSDIDLENSDMARRFFQEAKATRSITHPNVVRILDFGRDPRDGVLYLVMELLEGESVARALERGPLSEARTAAVGAAIAAGLEAAHAKGIIHRDLKPGNIFLCATGDVKLLDFGLAKVVKGAVHTEVGVVVGTPQYMAPEQVKSGMRIDPQTDVYGLGVVLFKMLTGRLPFIAKTLADLITAHLSERPSAPSQLVAVSPEMDALVLQCMEKDPARRPTMKEMATRLGKIAKRAARQHRRATGEMSQVMTLSSGTFTADEKTRPEAKPFGKQPSPLWRMAAPLVGVALFGAAVGAGLAYRHQAIVAREHAAAHLPIASPSVAPVAVPAPPAPGGLAAAPAGPPPSPPAATPAAPPPSAPTAPPAVAPALEKPPLVAGKAADASTPSAVEEVLVQSDPSGAQVFVDHEARGATPLAVTTRLPAVLKLTLDGYQTARKTLRKSGLIKIKLAPKAQSDPSASEKEPGDVALPE